jgi:amino acid transporter
VIDLGIIQIRLGGATVLACGIVAIFTAANVVGVSQVAALQNVLTGTKLTVVAAFLLMGFAIGSGRPQPHWPRSLRPAWSLFTTPTAAGMRQSTLRKKFAIRNARCQSRSFLEHWGSLVCTSA